MEKDVMNRLGDAYAEVQEATLKQRALAKAAKDAQPKDKVSLKKAPWDKKEEVEEDASNDKSDDGEGLDKADPKAAKKKFKDRKDKDIDNDGDTDDSDEFLHKKRKAISKIVKIKILTTMVILTRLMSTFINAVRLLANLLPKKRSILKKPLVAKVLQRWVEIPLKFNVQKIKRMLMLWVAM